MSIFLVHLYRHAAMHIRLVFDQKDKYKFHISISG